MSIVGSISRVDTPLLEEVSVALIPLLEIIFFSRPNVVCIDSNKIVSVRLRAIADESEGV